MFLNQISEWIIFSWSLFRFSDRLRAHSPSPYRHFGYFLHLMQSIGPNGPERGPIDPISYTMIVSGLLNPFLAILDIFDTYQALAILCKLE